MKIQTKIDKAKKIVKSIYEIHGDNGFADMELNTATDAIYKFIKDLESNQADVIKKERLVGK